MPLLELDDGTRITEGPAIVQYIADQVPAKKLAPPNGTMERVKLQTWLNFVTSELHKGFSPLFNPSMPDEAKKIFRERLGTRFAYLDKHLASQRLPDGQGFLGRAMPMRSWCRTGPAGWTWICPRMPTSWPGANASARGPRCRQP